MQVKNTLTVNKNESIETVNENESSKKVSFSSFMNTTRVSELILKTISPDEKQQFMTSIISAVGSNEKLRECDSLSILSGALLGHSLRLSPNPQLGQYCLVPFKDNRKISCTISNGI